MRLGYLSVKRQNVVKPDSAFPFFVHFVRRSAVARFPHVLWDGAVVNPCPHHPTNSPLPDPLNRRVTVR